MPRPPSITVDRNTTLTQLREFTDGLKDGKRLRGKENEDGSITLYSKDSKRGLGSLFGHSEKSVRKHDMARKAVETVIQNTERSMSVKSGESNPFENVRLALKNTTGGELTSGGLKLITSVVENKVHQDQGIVGGPGLTGIGKRRGEQLGEFVSGEIKKYAETGNKDTAISNIGDRLTNICQLLMSERKRENLALSNGSVLKNDLRTEIEPQLRKELGPDHPIFTTPSGEEGSLDDLLEGAFRHCTRQFLPNRENTDGSITIGEHTYQKDIHLSEGAHGSVDRYYCEETGKYIVLKTALAGSPESMQEFARELKSHRHVTGQENIVGLLGPVRMSGDTVGIALEYAPYGDFNKAMTEISKPENNVGTDDARLMRLTMLHDLAKGLGHMQSRTAGDGILHLDFGSRNMFIGENGVSKIGDFGLSTKVSKYDVEFTEGAKNTYMVAPELTLTRGENLQTRSQFTRRNSEEYQTTLGQFQQHFDGLNENKRKILSENVRENLSHGVTGERQPDAKKAEVWAFGIIAFEMMMGRLPVVGEHEGQDVSSVTENKYKEFGRDFTKRALNSYDDDGNLVPGFFGETTGNEEVDDLINQLMHPDPTKRPTPQQVLNHPAFTSEFFNSDTGHALIQQLLGGD
jgi:serine/threonine protein kinase